MNGSTRANWSCLENGAEPLAFLRQKIERLIAQRGANAK